VAQARALVFQMGSADPWLADEYQNMHYVITDRVVNGAPVWVAEGAVRKGEYFLVRCTLGMCHDWRV